MEKATRETAEKIIELLGHGLTSGKGNPIPGQMCVEALVCYAQGLPHSDEPVCVSPAVRAFKIELNDSSWSGNMARADGMRRLAIAQLNSAGAVDDKEFAYRVADLAIRKIAPFALRHAANAHPDQLHKNALESAAKRCEEDGTIAAAYAAAKAAAKAAKAAAYAANAAYAAAKAAYAVADAAADAAAKAAYADASVAAAYAANSAAVAVDVPAGDKFLAFIAEEVVQILIDMKAPGTEYLDLAPIQKAA